jgi:hypothetical protein
MGAPRIMRLPDQPEEKEAHRRMLWLAEDDWVAAQGAASRNAESRLDLCLRVRGLKPGAYAQPDGPRGSDTVSPGRIGTIEKDFKGFRPAFGRLCAPLPGEQHLLKDAAIRGVIVHY